MESISIGETHRIREFYYAADFASPWTRRILATNDTSPQPSPEEREKYHPGSFCPFSSGELACRGRSRDEVVKNFPPSTVCYNYH